MLKISSQQRQTESSRFRYFMVDPKSFVGLVLLRESANIPTIFYPSNQH